MSLTKSPPQHSASLWLMTSVLWQRTINEQNSSSPMRLTSSWTTVAMEEEWKQDALLCSYNEINNLENNLWTAARSLPVNSTLSVLTKASFIEYININNNRAFILFEGYWNCRVVKVLYKSVRGTHAHTHSSLGWRGRWVVYARKPNINHKPLRAVVSSLSFM